MTRITSVGRSRRIASLIAVVSLLVLTGCSGPLFPFGDANSTGNVDSGDSDQGVSIASLRPKQSPALEQYYQQRVVWKSCHGDLFCATVRAPVDWQNVTNQSISLALIKHPAKGKSLGELLTNPGGPGASGVEFVRDSVYNAVDGTIAKHFDVIGFDPRGVGASTPVKCFDAADADKYFYGIDPGTIGSKQWIAAERKKAVDLATACERNTGAVLDHIDTVNAAADMDVIRAALGQAKLDYLGYSYGTYLGTIYAGLFPKRVGKMILDGADDPWGSNYGSNSPGDTYGVDPADDGTVAQAVGFEGDLTAFLKSCLHNVGSTIGLLRCPFHSTLKDAQSRVAGFLSAVAAHPLSGPQGRKLGATTLAVAIDEPLYDTTQWPELTKLFVDMSHNNASEAFFLADQYNDRNADGSYDDNADLANLAIGCLEYGPSVDLTFDSREAAELRKVAPILGIYEGYGDLACSGWKAGPSPFPSPVHAAGTGPILVLGTTGDPATPYAEAQDLAAQLDGGHLVTLHGEGHTAYDRGDSCIDATVDAYLMHGTVPKADPECH